MRKALAVAVAAATGLAVAAAESMKVVTVVHARVQSDAPEWDDGAQTFVSTYGDSFAERYRGAFDSINTASVEGALMYVQAEGINVQDNTGCERKNEMQYIVFYALQVLQTEATIAAYDSDATNIPEYAPYVAMDSGSCTPEGTSLPAACLALFGGEEGTSSGNSSSTKEATVVLDVGPAVGAATKDSDARAPYPDTVWFSFPNSCVMETWAHKNSTCRSQYPGGLCAYGSRPDGDVCTFTYKTLGYLNLDDLVGITSLQSSVTGAPYANYSEFCHDRDGEYAGVEFSADDDNDPDSVVSIPFWADPYDETACANRTTAMIDMYNQRATEVEHMIALPTIETLRNANPPCYENSPRCAAAEFGCRRDLYAQICVVCESEEDGCVQASYTLSEVR